MEKRYLVLDNGLQLAFKGFVLFGLYLTSFYSYLLFHSLVEIFTIVIGFSVFIIVWNSRERMDNNCLIFIGITYFFVSSLDMLHLLSYKGMGVFTGYDADLPTQLWIAARYFQSVSWLVSFMYLNRKLNIFKIFGVFTIIILFVLADIFTGVFPACFVEGEGLTLFKKSSEYLISLIYLTVILLLYRNRSFFDHNVLRLLTIAMVFSIGAELAFTFYISVYGLSNLIGHFFKLIDFYLIYLAVIEVGLEEPQRILFRNLKKKEEALQKAAITDYLTGLYNRRRLEEEAEKEFNRARRYHLPLSFIMLDVDRFKQVNDTYGHAVGDDVLRSVAECFQKSLRGIDISARYGGDEFGVLLPETDVNAAGRVAERIMKCVGKISLNTDKGSLGVTVSVGIAVLGNEHSRFEDLLNDADKALYVSKEEGRNQISDNTNSSNRI